MISMTAKARPILRSGPMRLCPGTFSGCARMRVALSAPRSTRAAAHKLGLPFASDVFAATCLGEEIGDIPYDRKNHSSFSLWVNHKNTFTGITDRDPDADHHGDRPGRPGSHGRKKRGLSLQSRTRATARSCVQPTTCSTSAGARPSSRLRLPQWPCDPGRYDLRTAGRCHG